MPEKNYCKNIKKMDIFYQPFLIFCYIIIKDQKIFGLCSVWRFKVSSIHYL